MTHNCKCNLELKKITPFWTCPRHNSSPIKVRIAKLGPTMHLSNVKIHFNLGLDWPWSSISIFLYFQNLCFFQTLRPLFSCDVLHIFSAIIVSMCLMRPSLNFKSSRHAGSMHMVNVNAHRKRMVSTNEWHWTWHFMSDSTTECLNYSRTLRPEF